MSNWLDLPNEPGFWWHLDSSWEIGEVEVIEIRYEHLRERNPANLLVPGSESCFTVLDLGGIWQRINIEKPAWPEDVIFEKQLHKISVEQQ
jgi:hypothetical protein